MLDSLALRFFLLLSCSAFVLVPADANANAFTFGSGWWSATLANSDNNSNYGTGDVPSDDTVRGFLTFDLSSLALEGGENISSAVLTLTRYSYVSSDASETIGLYEISTDAVTLNNNIGPNAAIFDDLGTGAEYGQFVINAFSLSPVETFSLNAAGLSDISFAFGGFFSIGQAILSAVSNQQTEYVFGGSSAFGTQSLTIETSLGRVLSIEATDVPEPAVTLLICLGGSALSLSRLRNRRRS